jgi:hypothetical protein
MPEAGGPLCPPSSNPAGRFAKEDIMAKKDEVEFKVGRDAKSGEFIPVKEAERRPNTTIVETIRRPK